MSNGSGPDLERRAVGPDPGPNCLQRLSADDLTILETYEGEVSKPARELFALTRGFSM